MEGVSGFGADVGALADAVSEASNDWRQVIVRPSHVIPNRVSRKPLPKMCISMAVLPDAD